MLVRCLLFQDNHPNFLILRALSNRSRGPGFARKISSPQLPLLAVNVADLIVEQIDLPSSAEMPATVRSCPISRPETGTSARCAQARALPGQPKAGRRALNAPKTTIQACTRAFSIQRRSLSRSTAKHAPYWSSKPRTVTEPDCTLSHVLQLSCSEVTQRLTVRTLHSLGSPCDTR